MSEQPKQQPKQKQVHFLTKDEWIARYGGQDLLDREGLIVIPCLAECDDPICHGWRVRKVSKSFKDLMERTRQALPEFGRTE
jgi:hypothetical protein